MTQRAASHVRKKLQMLLKDEDPITAAEWDRLATEFGQLARVCGEQKHMAEEGLDG